MSMTPEDAAAGLSISFKVALLQTYGDVRRQLGDRIAAGGRPLKTVAVYVRDGRARGVVRFAGKAPDELDIPLPLLMLR